MTRYALVPDRSQVTIEGSSSVHPVHATARGVEGWFDARVENGVVTAVTDGRVEIAVDALRSGNPLVDRETRRRIDSRRHPLIVGRVTGPGAPGDDPGFPLRGVIDFRGESREVEGWVDVEPGDGSLRVRGSQTFDVRDWGLEPPRLLTLRVHPDVTVRIDLEAEPEG